MKELQEKAKFFEISGLVPTLDADATVIKADTLVPEALSDSLREAFNRLMEDDEPNPLSRPGTSDIVRDLVDPTLFPLIYGRSRVLQEEEVGVADAIYRWAGKGTVIPKPPHVDYSRDRFMSDSYTIRACYWSEAYQWLPANVKFQADGGVKFTSYINNLHPTKYRDVYDALEKLVGVAFPAWDYCVSPYDCERLGPGRCEARFPMPKDPE